jgi:hypothetical protein
MIRAGVDDVSVGREAFSKRFIHWYPSNKARRKWLIWLLLPDMTTRPARRGA